MNSRCKELGGLNSNFVNTNGLEDPNHYTTARDMALITRELLNNHPEFEEICQTMQYTIPATNLTSETRTFQQKHQMFYEGNEYYDARVIAGKTGYTDLALNTLVTCADDGNRRLICVVLRTHGRNVYSDTEALLNYGFDNFQKVSIKEREKSENIKSIDENAYVLLPSGVEFESLEMKLIPDSNDKTAGIVEYTYDGHLVGTASVQFSDVYLEKNEPEMKPEEKKKEQKENSVWKWIIWIVAGIVILGTIFFLFLLAVAVKRKKKREAQRRRRIARKRKRQQEERYRQMSGERRRERSRRDTRDRYER